jgi:hypothetical protein
MSQPSGMTYQQRQERLQCLADVFVSIFRGLSPEQRARYTDLIAGCSEAELEEANA